MTANDRDANMPIQIQLVSNSSADSAASRIPDAIAAAAIAPGTVATLFAADDGERSLYNDPAVLRAGDSGQTSTSTSAPTPEINLSASGDAGGELGDGE